MSVVLVSLTAALIGSLAYIRARRALEKEARVRLTLSARSIAEHLHRELEDRAADITNWAHLEVMRAVLYEDVDKQLAEFIRQILSGRQTYRAILCTDSAGRPVASAGKVEAVVSAGGASRPRISIVPVGRNSDERALRLDTPIFLPDHPESSVGTLVVLVSPHHLLNAVDATLRAAGAQVSLTLRSGTGEILLEAAGSPTQPRRRPTDRMQSATLTGAAAVVPLLNIDSPELEVVVAEPIEVALAAATALRATLIKIGMFALVVGSLFGALVAWRIGLPIRRLTATVRQITERGQLGPVADFPPASGEVGMLAAAFRAMTESLVKAQDEAVAQSRLAFLGEVAANIAHEVRTPLSVLKTSTQLLARPDIPFAEQRKLAETAVVEVDRLNRVVADLVDLARPKPVRYRAESVAEIVERALVFFATSAAKSGVEVVYTGDGLQPLYCSADQLYQVFLNLIHNALQAMAGSGCLAVRCYGENECVVVEVDDTGPGISPQVLSKLFSPFCTTKADGTGLGLAISKRIVEEHGGTITAENLPERGAHFRLRLPRNRENT